MANPKRIKSLLKLWNWYGPYVGMGIRLKSYNESLTRFEVQMKLKWYNRNLFRTHFGGSLYAMTDGIHAMILALHLGKAYIVWDKASCIDFLKPGEGTVRAVFEISEQEIEQIRQDLESKEKEVLPFQTEIKNEQDETVAKVTHNIYIRKKSR
jgi:acyl-coenzyme A thioesterase PaaI-like protein